MNRITGLAHNHPLIFSLLTILGWFFIGALLVLASVIIFSVPMNDELPQIIGTLGATLILLLITNRLGWLGEIGLTRLGGWRLWVLVLLMGVYLSLAYVFGFFEQVGFNLGSSIRSGAAYQVLFRQGVVGFVEETLFRGVILYVLVRAWGNSRRGLWVAVIVQAVLFGFFHILQVLVGNPLSSVVMVMINGIVSGIWWGAISLASRTLWPVIFLHATSNAAVMIMGMSSAYIEPAVWAYARATLLELPLLVFGLFLLARTPLGAEPVIEESSQEQASTV